MKRETLTLDHTKIKYNKNSIWSLKEQRLIKEYSERFEIENK